MHCPLHFSPFVCLTLIPLVSPQACKERELSQAQLKAFSQQTEGVRRELAEVLGRLAQSEEEVLRKDVELSETRARHLGLEQEVREVREASIALEEEAQRQSVLQVRLREENQSLEERAESMARRSQRDQEVGYFIAESERASYSLI